MFQKIQLIGNLGKDPEMRYLPDGTPVTNFSIATNRKYTTNGQQVDETTWFRVTVWNKQAESVNTYLHQGSKVFVEGRLTGDPQTGGPKLYSKNDGTMGASFEITANVVKFLDPNPNGGNGNGNAQRQAAAPAQAVADDAPPW